MKKIVSICLVLTMLFSMTVFVSADELTIEEKRAYLHEQGLPLSFLDNREDIEISELYDDLYGKEIESFTSETSLMNETSNSNTGIMPIGTISSSDMEFTISKIIYSAINTENYQVYYREFHIWVDYLWKNDKPAMAFTDAITVNWNPDLLTYAGSFSAKCYKMPDEGDNWVLYDEFESPAESALGAVGLYVDIKSGPYQQKGSMNFNLVPAINPMYNPNSSTPSYNTTSIDALYVHNKTFGGSIGFSFAGFGININYPLIYDSVAASSLLEYYW